MAGISFLIGGVQKCGTTALARCLAQHPDVALPHGKEAHVFDAPGFDDAWSVAEIDACYAPHFDPATSATLRGDATPIYCLHRRFVARIARYNPALRWIVLLRDPVERAISHYYMERGRGNETWPLWAALLLEDRRLRGHLDDFADDSSLRIHSYRLRGDYARQLDVLYAHFPREQVLLLQSTALRATPRPVLERVYRHLGLAGPVRLPDDTDVFTGTYAAPGSTSPTRLLARWLLARPLARLRRQHGITFDGDHQA